MRAQYAPAGAFSGVIAASPWSAARAVERIACMRKGSVAYLQYVLTLPPRLH